MGERGREDIASVAGIDVSDAREVLLLLRLCEACFSYAAGFGIGIVNIDGVGWKSCGVESKLVPNRCDLNGSWDIDIDMKRAQEEILRPMVSFCFMLGKVQYIQRYYGYKGTKSLSHAWPSSLPIWNNRGLG
jgi:hypothetical protein